MSIWGAAVSIWGAASAPLRKSLAKGIVCGLIAGTVGSYCKVIGEKIYQPRTLGQVPPPLVLLEKVDGPVPPEKAGMQISLVHYAFGAAAGGVYGAVAEFAPSVTGAWGVGFGLVLQLFTHETLVPAAGLDVPPWKQPAREHISEFFSHALYGLGTEVTRRLLRKLWK